MHGCLRSEGWLSPSPTTKRLDSHHQLAPRSGRKRKPVDVRRREIGEQLERDLVRGEHVGVLLEADFLSQSWMLSPLMPESTEPNPSDDQTRSTQREIPSAWPPSLTFFKYPTPSDHVSASKSKSSNRLIGLVCTKPIGLVGDARLRHEIIARFATRPSPESLQATNATAFWRLSLSGRVPSKLSWSTKIDPHSGTLRRRSLVCRLGGVQNSARQFKDSSSRPRKAARSSSQRSRGPAFAVRQTG